MVRKYAGEGIDLGKVREGLDGLVAEHISEGSKLSQKTAGMTGKFDEPIKEIRFAGKGGRGADIVATMTDGRTIGREVTTFKKGADTASQFKMNLAIKIEEEFPQFAKTPVKLDIKEIHIQMSSGTNFVSKENLYNAIKEGLRDNIIESGFDVNKVLLYDETGNILAIWTR